jgi:signal transduction histidine kinase
VAERDGGQADFLLRHVLDDPDGPGLADLPGLLRRAAQQAAELNRCRSAAVVLHGADGRRSRYVPEGVDDSWLDLDPGTARAIDAVVQRAGTVQLPSRPNARALLGVPFVLRGRIAGGLFLTDPIDRDGFSDSDERTATALAAAVAALIEKSHTAIESERRDRWLSGAASLTRELVSALPGNPLQLIVERVREIAEADVVSIVQPGDDGAAFVVRASAGEREGERSWVGETLPEALSRSAARAAAGEPVNLPRIGESGLLDAETAELFEVESAILVPLAGPGRRGGLLTIGRRPGHPAFTAAELGVATMFAAQVALALELAANQARRDEFAVGAERDRIARDLHDHVIQRLFAIGLAAQGAGADLGGPSAEQLRSSLGELDEAINEIRSVIYRLTGPLVSSETSLRTRAARLLNEMEPVLGFRPSLELSGAVDFGISEDVVHDCIAVLREALTNVARHARASAAGVVISVDRESIVVEVRDDGHGLGRSTRRSGLANLRARADRRGGSLSVESDRATGTRVVWSIPSGDADGETPPENGP